MDIYLKTRDYAVTGEDFSLILDRDLGLLRTEPVPENLSPYYEHESYIPHTDRSKTWLEKGYQLAKKYALKRKTSWLRAEVLPGADVMDIGAGTGSFVQYLKAGGWRAEGMEPGKKARDIALSKGVQLYESLDQLPNRKYDAVTLWHVLEHFKDLDKEIDLLLTKIKDTGTLFIAVPNFKSYDAQFYKMYWAGYDVPRHLWHFSKDSIEKIFHSKGWGITRTRPMIFDSFYVSLLSERYRGKHMIWPRAVWMGLRSNLYGWRTGQYSSHVYILKKKN